MSRFLFRDARAVFLEATFDEAVARALVPRPLKVDIGRYARFFFAEYPRFGRGPGFRESGLYLPVRYGAIRGYFCPWMLVDDARSRHMGRRYLALPKEMGDLAWREDGAVVTASAVHEGTGAQVVATRGAGVATARAFRFLSFGLRRMPAPLPALLVAYTVRERVALAERCDVALTMHGSLGELGLAPREATHMRFDFGGDGTFPVPVGATYRERWRGVAP